MAWSRRAAQILVKQSQICINATKSKTGLLRSKSIGSIGYNTIAVHPGSEYFNQTQMMRNTSSDCHISRKLNVPLLHGRRAHSLHLPTENSQKRFIGTKTADLAFVATKKATNTKYSDSINSYGQLIPGSTNSANNKTLKLQFMEKHSQANNYLINDNISTNNFAENNMNVSYQNSNSNFKLNPAFYLRNDKCQGSNSKDRNSNVVEETDIKKELVESNNNALQNNDHVKPALHYFLNYRKGYFQFSNFIDNTHFMQKIIPRRKFEPNQLSSEERNVDIVISENKDSKLSDNNSKTEQTLDLFSQNYMKNAKSLSKIIAKNLQIQNKHDVMNNKALQEQFTDVKTVVEEQDQFIIPSAVIINSELKDKVVKYFEISKSLQTVDQEKNNQTLQKKSAGNLKPDFHAACKQDEQSPPEFLINIKDAMKIVPNNIGTKSFSIKEDKLLPVPHSMQENIQKIPVRTQSQPILTMPKSINYISSEQSASMKSSENPLYKIFKDNLIMESKAYNSQYQPHKKEKQDRFSIDLNMSNSKNSSEMIETGKFNASQEEPHATSHEYITTTTKSIKHPEELKWINSNTIAQKAESNEIPPKNEPQIKLNTKDNFFNPVLKAQIKNSLDKSGNLSTKSKSKGAITSHSSSLETEFEQLALHQETEIKSSKFLINTNSKSTENIKQKKISEMELYKDYNPISSTSPKNNEGMPLVETSNTRSFVQENKGNHVTNKETPTINHHLRERSPQQNSSSEIISYPVKGKYSDKDITITETTKPNTNNNKYDKNNMKSKYVLTNISGNGNFEKNTHNISHFKHERGASLAINSGNLKATEQGPLNLDIKKSNKVRWTKQKDSTITKILDQRKEKILKSSQKAKENANKHHSAKSNNNSSNAKSISCKAVTVLNVKQDQVTNNNEARMQPQTTSKTRNSQNILLKGFQNYNGPFVLTKGSMQNQSSQKDISKPILLENTNTSSSYTNESHSVTDSSKALTVVEKEPTVLSPVSKSTDDNSVLKDIEANPKPKINTESTEISKASNTNIDYQYLQIFTPDENNNLQENNSISQLLHVNPVENIYNLVPLKKFPTYDMVRKMPSFDEEVSDIPKFSEHNNENNNQPSEISLETEDKNRELKNTQSKTLQKTHFYADKPKQITQNTKKELKFSIPTALTENRLLSPSFESEENRRMLDPYRGTNIRKVIQNKLGKVTNTMSTAPKNQNQPLIPILKPVNSIDIKQFHINKENKPIDNPKFKTKLQKIYKDPQDELDGIERESRLIEMYLSKEPVKEKLSRLQGENRRMKNRKLEEANFSSMLSKGGVDTFKKGKKAEKLHLTSLKEFSPNKKINLNYSTQAIRNSKSEISLSKPQVYETNISNKRRSMSLVKTHMHTSNQKTESYDLKNAFQISIRTSEIKADNMQNLSSLRKNRSSSLNEERNTKLINTKQDQIKKNVQLVRQKKHPVNQLHERKPVSINEFKSPKAKPEQGRNNSLGKSMNNNKNLFLKAFNKEDNLKEILESMNPLPIRNSIAPSKMKDVKQQGSYRHDTANSIGIKKPKQNVGSKFVKMYSESNDLRGEWKMISLEMPSLQSLPDKQKMDLNKRHEPVTRENRKERISNFIENLIHTNDKKSSDHSKSDLKDVSYVPELADLKKFTVGKPENLTAAPQEFKSIPQVKPLIEGVFPNQEYFFRTPAIYRLEAKDELLQQRSIKFSRIIEKYDVPTAAPEKSDDIIKTNDISENPLIAEENDSGTETAKGILHQMWNKILRR